MARLFVVRTEGGKFEFLSKEDWDREINTVPIFGIELGNVHIIHDRTLKRYGFCPIRIHTNR